MKSSQKLRLDVHGVHKATSLYDTLTSNQVSHPSNMLLFEYPQRFRKPYRVGMIEKQERKSAGVCSILTPNNPKPRLPSTFNHFTVISEIKSSKFLASGPTGGTAGTAKTSKRPARAFAGRWTWHQFNLCRVSSRMKIGISDTQYVWNPWWWWDHIPWVYINLMF